MKKEKLIKKYDSHVELHSKQHPTIEQWRERLLDGVQGNVLESGVGTGANFPYYERDIRLTGVDFSPKMIERAREEAEGLGIEANLFVEDIEEVELEPNQFDYVVSTLTLCSYPNPVEVLNRFAEWCKDDGEVLLLEHGRSTKPSIGTIQKWVDPVFHQIAGCHSDHMTLDLIKESNLTVTKAESHWSGIFHLVWARPRA
ncbi:class I SAM-dependent methyltransferase [Halobacillus salinus]|uniref:Class I SAM-dependent methyltransferase n=1 Tax=Halobacillus salinus TaxID=192814 RepID=A0A4Z0H190_9BACI|nr:class I SAM-dependent methyltransferase [Halobacillus salinus]TGB03749.1 class I SAM-dependent methyltransferase [Halobacillus salinus]